MPRRHRDMNSSSLVHQAQYYFYNSTYQEGRLLYRGISFKLPKEAQLRNVHEITPGFRLRSIPPGASKPLFITDKGAGSYFVHVPYVEKLAARVGKGKAIAILAHNWTEPFTLFFKCSQDTTLGF